MRWVCIDNTHINTYNIDTFYWLGGQLRVFFSGKDKAVVWKDPDREIYLQLCHQLGIRPGEEAEAYGKK